MSVERAGKAPEGAYVACGAEDYPVWADGSQDRMVCQEPAGHAGPHEAADGDWSWALDMRQSAPRSTDA